MSDFCQGFAPILGKNPTVLILGTMPSVASLEEAFYYAHPRNAFWPIMSVLLNRPVETVKQKTAAIESSQIVIWDVLQACQRSGSLDSAIKAPQANDFEKLFKQNPSLKHVFFNGQAAAKLFTKEVSSHQDLPEDLILVTLPSTSPANARLTIQDKVLLWQEKLQDLL